MKELIIKEVKETYIGYFRGSFHSLSEIDFSLLNVKFVDIESKDYKAFINQVSDESGILTEPLKNFKSNSVKQEVLHALIPIDISKPVTELDLWKVRNVMLLIYPSDFFLEILVGYRLYDDSIDLFLYDNYRQQKLDPLEPFKNYIFLDKHLVKNINKFIQLFFERYDNIKYLFPAFNSYITSYFQNFSNMEYLSLCISLEAIVDAHTELTFRIKRNVAVLLSSNEDFGKRIFKNIGLIYTLRSKIAHSGKYDEAKINEYLPFLRNLVSVLIIELIKLNIVTLAELNELLNSKGYGDIYEQDKDFIDFELNHKPVTKVFVTELTK